MQATFDPFGTADLASLDEEFPDGIAAPEIEIPDAGVERIIALVDATGIGPQIERWEAIEQAELGGRPKPYPARTPIVGLLLAALIHGVVNDTVVHLVLYFQISDKMRERLGIRLDNPGICGSFPDYYRRLNRRFNGIIETFDPSPTLKNHIMLVTEAEAKMKPLTAEQILERRDRMDWVVHQILLASFMAMPRRLRRKWKGNLAVDGTPLRQFTRGVKRDSEWCTADGDCGWYMREGDNAEGHAKAEGKLSDAKVGTGSARQSDSKGRKYNRKEAFWGLEGTLGIMCGDNLDGTADHPNLVMGMVVDKPGFRIGENGTRVIRQVAERTGEETPPGWLTGDRAYPNSKPENFQIPTRELGYSHVFDYREDQLGVKANFGGAIQVEGTWYCPLMPTYLIDASIHFKKDKSINEATWRIRLAERQRYELVVKETYYDGRVRRSSPATMSNPAVACGRKPKSTKVSKSSRLGRTPIIVPAGDDKPSICAQEAVTFPVEAGAKFFQELRYHSPEWEARYGIFRNTNEGFNGTAKDGSHSGLGQASRRRKRGLAAQSLLCVALLFAENIRRIDAFMKKAKEDEQGDLITTRKRRARRPRRRLEETVSSRGDAPENEAPPPDE